MEIRKMAELYALYPEAQPGIRYDSPELLMIQYISEGSTEKVLTLFREKRQFSENPPAVDARGAGLRAGNRSAASRKASSPALRQTA